MTATGKTFPSLVDSLKTANVNGENDVVELMAQSNPLIKDAFYQPCNDGTAHDITVRSGIPKATWRGYYEGTPYTSSDFANVKIQTGMLESKGAVDVKQCKHHKNPAMFRLIQNKGHIEAMGNTVEEELFYGKRSNGARFDGLAQLYNTVSNNKGELGYNVIDAGGTASDKLTSIYCVTWGDGCASLIHPDSATSGLVHTDKGEQPVRDKNGNEFYAYVDLYQWDLGLAVEDWHTCGRIVNIPVNKLDEVDLDALMSKLYRRMKKYIASMAKGQFEADIRGELVSAKNTVFYASDEVIGAFEEQIKNKNNIHFATKEYLDEDIECFKKIPIRQADAISNEEKKVG